MSTTRRLIVNADDFGRSHGINRGVFIAHAHGIVTSASVMVRWPAALDAVTYARRVPKLSLGLHIDLAEWVCSGHVWSPNYRVVDLGDPAAIRHEVWRQIERFDQLYGVYPTHLDSHQHVHRHEPARSVVIEIADHLGVPVREENARVAYCGDFHGQSGRGEPLHHAITVGALAELIGRLPEGTTEVGCHPGIGDESGSVYGLERDLEVQALCDPRIHSIVQSGGVALVSFQDVIDMG
jgi:predicted glycoside hydrolase/deacetylase ChbG (UPF0249 family)